MSYIDLQNLTGDPAFLGRICYAINSYAAYISNEATDATNHAMRLNWAVKAKTNTPGMASVLAPGVIQNTNVISGLSAVTDANLQVAVENAANTQINVPVSYTDLMTLAGDPLFLRRIQASVAYLANYILGEAAATANHVARYNWAKTALVNPSGVVAQIVTSVVMNGTVQAAMYGITDAALQPIVESSIITLLL